MEARRSTMAAYVRWEDVVRPMEVPKAGSEASVIPPPTEPNVVPTAAEPSVVVPISTELPSSSPTAPSTDIIGGATIELE